jgi:hypothetical protein
LPETKSKSQVQDERRLVMTTKTIGLVETVKNGVVGAVKGTGDIAKATAGYRRQHALHSRQGRR